MPMQMKQHKIYYKEIFTQLHPIKNWATDVTEFKVPGKKNEVVFKCHYRSV